MKEINWREANYEIRQRLGKYVVWFAVAILFIFGRNEHDPHIWPAFFACILIIITISLLMVDKWKHSQGRFDNRNGFENFFYFHS